MTQKQILKEHENPKSLSYVGVWIGLKLNHRHSYKIINDEVGKKKRPYWTYWFLAWRLTHLPVDRWLGKGIGSGPCG